MALTFVPCILNTACRSPNMTDYSRRFSCAPVHQVRLKLSAHPLYIM